MKVTYIGSFFDNSGYGVAARKNLLALEKSGKVEMRAINRSFAPNTKKVSGEEQRQLEEICNRNPDDCDVVFMQLTPEQYDQYIDRFKDKFKIGHVAWETTLIPKRWVSSCNRMNAMMVSCNWNVDVFYNSGVKVPVEYLPYSLDVNKFDRDIETSKIGEHYSDRLKFYSVFQWTERKNPKGLIRTYLSRFNKDDKVVLILKTYHGSGSPRDTDYLKEEIDNIYAGLNKPKEKMPKMLVIPDIMTDDELIGLHKACDVYVAPVRGEGFGIPIFDAALAEKHIIATAYSSQLDFLKRGIHSLVSYQLEPVHSMPWIPWYFSNQMWAEPDLQHFGDFLVEHYQKWLTGELNEFLKEERKEWANKLKQEYSYEAVSDLFVQKINDIMKEKGVQS